MLQDFIQAPWNITGVFIKDCPIWGLEREELYSTEPEKREKVSAEVVWGMGMGPKTQTPSLNKCFIFCIYKCFISYSYLSF
jgi:hypothetical protein